MKIAVLPVSVSDRSRSTTLTRTWIQKACESVKRYFEDQSGGRERPEFEVFDWFGLSLTTQQWMALGGNVMGTVNQELVAKRGDVLSTYEHFIYIIDDGISRSAATNGLETRISATDLDPALLAHELTHVYGADDTFLQTPGGPSRYDALFCIMGDEGRKHSFRDGSLVPENDPTDAERTDCGPGMCVPTLLKTGWLDLTKHGVHVQGYTSGLSASTARMRALDGAPQQAGGVPVCCYVDDGDRYLVEYRLPSARWDAGLPEAAAGWLVVHRTPIDEPLVTLEVASFPVVTGKTVAFGGPETIYIFGGGPLRVSILAFDIAARTVDVRFSRPRAKVPQYRVPFEAFIRHDDHVLWTGASGWRVIPADSDLALVLERVSELDQVRELTRLSSRHYAVQLAEANQRLRTALQESVARIDGPEQALEAVHGPNGPEPVSRGISGAPRTFDA